jgi:hypothetical protein
MKVDPARNAYIGFPRIQRVREQAADLHATDWRDSWRAAGWESTDRPGPFGEQNRWNVDEITKCVCLAGILRHVPGPADICRHEQ